MIPRVATIVLLAALLAHAARVQAQGAATSAVHAPPPLERAVSPSALPDGGTIRASGLVVPKSLQEERAESPEPHLPLIALGTPDVLEALGEFRPEIGAWAEYAITEHQHQTGRILISVLPPPMPDGNYWLEIDSINEQAYPVALRLLAHGNPGRVSSIARAIIYVPGQGPIELPLRLANEEHSRPAPAPSGAGISTTHGEKVKVAAGSFTADRIRIGKGKESTTLWRSLDVPLFGLVKSVAPGKEIELSASGHTGGHTLFAAPVADEAIPPEAMSGQGASGDGQGNGSDSK